jgi:hypothetical protein
MLKFRLADRLGAAKRSLLEQLSDQLLNNPKIRRLTIS